MKNEANGQIISIWKNSTTRSDNLGYWPYNVLYLLKLNRRVPTHRARPSRYTKYKSIRTLNQRPVVLRLN